MSMKNCKKAGLTPILPFDNKLQQRTPRELGVQASMQAALVSQSKSLYSYIVYREGKTIRFLKSAPAAFDGRQFIERFVVPAGAEFVANGHVHPALTPTNRFRWSSRSQFDKNLSDGRDASIFGKGPVTFLNMGGNVFHEYNQGNFTDLTVTGYKP
ncbi:MAG: hypothetical protein M3R59_06360 [Verrucomicrobiota bacterium]|nr:hypothetical protein [Verrucomicrobiota bacterium]